MRAVGPLTLPLLVALILLVFCANLFAQPSAPYRVIVHPSNPAAGADRKFLEDAFLKKITRWPEGEVIRPVDLAPSSPVRRRFTEDVLKRSVEAVKSYWQHRIFAGRDLPPPELDSDAEVVSYVAKHSGAVGYVSIEADVNGVKILGMR